VLNDVAGNSFHYDELFAQFFYLLENIFGRIFIRDDRIDSIYGKEELMQQTEEFG